MFSVDRFSGTAQAGMMSVFISVSLFDQKLGIFGFFAVFPLRFPLA